MHTLAEFQKYMVIWQNKEGTCAELWAQARSMLELGATTPVWPVVLNKVDGQTGDLAWALQGQMKLSRTSLGGRKIQLGCPHPGWSPEL